MFERYFKKKKFLLNIKIDRKQYQIEEANGDIKIDVEADEKDKDKNQEKKDQEVKKIIQ